MYMEEYNIKILMSAQIDILDIVDHLNMLSPEAALKGYDLFIEQIGTLAESPERYPVLRDTQLRLRG